MKNVKQLAIAALILGTSVLTAQTEKKTATVRIKKVENINGVEKVTDTTYTTDDPTSIKMEHGNVEIKELRDGKGTKKVVIMDVESDGKGKEMTDAEIQSKIEAFTIDDPKAMEGKQVIVKKVGKCDATKEEIDGVKEEFHVTIIRRIDIKDASEEDMKRLSKQTGAVDQKLQMDKMNMSPNPSNGKFDLNFNLKNKGDAEINVFNMEGKQVYNEKLSGFQGEYKKSIDLSNNNKGVYFVKIQQGTHSQVKKVVIE
jgi:hypothetical protein